MAENIEEVKWDARLESELIYKYICQKMPPRGAERLDQLVATAELSKRYRYLPKILSLNGDGTSFIVRNFMDGYVMGSEEVNSVNKHVLVFSIFFENISEIPLDFWMPTKLGLPLKFNDEPLVAKLPVLKTENGSTKILITDTNQLRECVDVDVKPARDRIMMDVFTYNFLRGIKEYYMIVPTGRSNSVSGINIENTGPEDQTKRWLLLDLLQKSTIIWEEEKRKFVEQKRQENVKEEKRISIEEID